MKRYVVDGLPVAVYNCGGTLRATADTCTHAEASLADGFLDCEAGSVECPDREAELVAQLVERVDATHPGADNDRVEFGSLVRHW